MRLYTALGRKRGRAGDNGRDGTRRMDFGSVCHCSFDFYYTLQMHIWWGIGTELYAHMATDGQNERADENAKLKKKKKQEIVSTSIAESFA